MIGVSLFDAASQTSEGNWGVAILTIVVMTLCSQYLRNITIPLPMWRAGKIRLSRVHVFKLFPILITILVMWGFCAILTVSGAISEENGARTDKNLQLVYNAAWFRFPYPCKVKLYFLVFLDQEALFIENGL